MFDYLQKFNTLPQNLRDSVSSPAAMAVISELETKYKIDLAATVMKVMAKIIPLADLSIFFVSDFSLDEISARKLTADLKERLFFPVSNYLGYNASYSSVVPKTTPAPVVPASLVKPIITSTPAATTSVIFSDVDKVIKESGVTFAGFDLNSRFKTILNTYLKGIRSRVDTRLTLSKEVMSGGLGLSHQIIDRIFKICDEIQTGKMLPSGAMVSLPNREESKIGLEKVRALYEKPENARDIPYDLKEAISKGEIKKPITPFNLPVPEESKEKLLEEKNEETRAVIVTPQPIKISDIKSVVPSLNPSVIIPKAPEPIADVIKTAATLVATKPLEAVKTANPIAKSFEDIKPVSSNVNSPKIVRPPEKKPSIFSAMFNSRKSDIQNVVSEVKKPISETKPVPVNQPSITALRSEAASSQNKPTPRKESIFSIPTVDVKPAPKVMGPLEELRYLDIINFRRLGSSPAEATTKIESKIKLLEKDGYDKMVSGVAAWRESPVNSLYLKMGEESLSKGMSFKQYADSCKTLKTNNFLSWEEIEAILILNGRLMF